jgi:transcriptional regulator with XRE-family HTH domain
VTVAGYQNVAQRNLTCAIRIKERRRELGLTQAEVVERVARYGSRLSNQALSAIENGRRLAVGRLPDLAEALDCTVTYLIGLTADPHRWQPDLPQPRQPTEVPSESTAQPAAPGAPGTSARSHRSWILGPDVPDMSGGLRGRAPRPHPSERPR